MAELASSVITLANVSLVIIEKTVKYIKDINLVTDLIKDLLAQLKELHRLIRVVEFTYRQVGASDDSPSSRAVGKSLTTCQERMEKLKPLLFEMAALESETWLQKLAVRRRMDRVQKKIEFTIRDIRGDMKSMSFCMSCWSLDVASAHRRISEAIAAQQGLSIHTGTPAFADQEINPIQRSLSQAATVFGHDADLPIRRISTAVSSSSRPSISSTSSRAPPTLSDRSNSITSATEFSPINTKSGWEKFHFHIAKCGGDADRIRHIRQILQRHAEGSTLAKSTDTWDRTPLHVAAQFGDVELARILVSFGADIDARDSEPSSVLDMAVASRHRGFVAYLLDEGVDETAVLPRNMAGFKAMKRAIQFENQQAAIKQSRIQRQSTQPGVLM
ncbi:hypothetical protein GQ44DRAFT_615939 [Phaeosphaeriaceae sp. PMI808]|nr:hypothetical protein GQ44DRAFT_615939 [Phaeosphaeriaceae sp. PMI808]